MNCLLILLLYLLIFHFCIYQLRCDSFYLCTQSCDCLLKLLFDLLVNLFLDLFLELLLDLLFQLLPDLLLYLLSNQGDFVLFLFLSVFGGFWKRANCWCIVAGAFVVGNVAQLYQSIGSRSLFFLIFNYLI